MSSSIIRQSYDSYRKQKMHDIGSQGEENVLALLNTFFDKRILSYGMDGYSEGTNYCPDIVLKTDPIIAIEVKSMNPYKNRQRSDRKVKGINWLGINKNQWRGEKQFATDRLMEIILILEVRTKEGNYIYLWFEKEYIDSYLEFSDSLWMHFSLFDLLENGNRLMTIDDLNKFYNWIINKKEEILKNNVQSQLVIA